VATDFYIKDSDTLPAIQAILTDATDTVVNLSGCTVRFIMTNKSTAVVAVDAAATVVNAAGGVVRYNWVTGDTDIAGGYRAEWEVTFGGGGVETFPNSTYMNIKITGDLGGTVS